MPQVHGAVWLLEAFFELSTTRSFSMGGAGPIPVTAAWQWCDRFGGPIWFPDAIRTIDGFYLEGVNSQ